MLAWLHPIVSRVWRRERGEWVPQGHSPSSTTLCQLCYLRAVVLLSLTHARAIQLLVPGNHTHICHFNISLSCSIPSLSRFLLSVALHLGVLLAFIVDCVLFQVPTPYSMPWWLAHHGTPRVASCTFQPCFRNVISFKLEAVSRGASLSSWGAPRSVLGEGYCDHGKGRQVSLLGGCQDSHQRHPQAKDPGDVPGSTHAYGIRYMYLPCISGA